MKLLFCPDCDHIFSLGYRLRTCECGKVSGRYVDRVTAEINGRGISLAMDTEAFSSAITRMRALGDAPPQVFQESCRVDHCWVRPHGGQANPNTVVRDTSIRRTVWDSLK